MNDNIGSAISSMIEQALNRSDFDFDESWPSKQKIKIIKELDSNKVREEQLLMIVEKNSDPAVKMAALKKIKEIGGSPLTWFKIASNDSDKRIRKYSIKIGFKQNTVVKQNALALLVSMGTPIEAAQQKVNNDLGKTDKDIIELMKKSPYEEIRRAVNKL